MLFNKEVTVDYDKRDRHGRIVGKVLLEGNDVCIRQIEDGLAWHFKKYEDEQPAVDRVRYSRAESDARARRVGLWRDPHPVPPWEFRHNSSREAKLRKQSCTLSLALLRSSSQFVSAPLSPIILRLILERLHRVRSQPFPPRHCLRACSVLA